MNKTPCPLCDHDLTIIQVPNKLGQHTTIYKCEPCPFIGFEYYTDEDMEALSNNINIWIAFACRLIYIKPSRKKKRIQILYLKRI